MPNRLNRETSPYLLQHAGNPVDWYPWGPEAIDCAKQENKPIFLSIGYSACHWCHVMEHESFEDERIAQAMNEHFVCIKVDREERPDLDQIYMSAVQMMTGRGGWPMSVFLTPELKPFYGGTYWPPTARMGMPGFDQVLSAVAEAWRDRQSLAREQADSLTGQIRAFAAPPGAAGKLETDILQRAVATLERAFDPRFGGFGAAPKFPHPMDLRLLLHAWRRKPSDELLGVVTLTLDRMAAGGMYDQLGGGFHRYSVDERWLVPHFEKMLYDNALLAAAYLEGFLATKNQEYARVVHETCGYVLREMTGADGGLFSTQDADSEGEEGKFFFWTTQQLTDVLGAERARTFAYVYDVTEEGNFEHRNILNMPKTFEQCAQILGRDAGDLRQELADSRAKLLAEREKRVHPALDDKVLLSWNGLMIDALAQASSALGESRYLIAAAGVATFVLERMRRPDGRMLHSWRQGAAKLDGYLDDYSCFINALVSLYEADFDERWIDEAVRLADLMVELFSDPSGGGFFFTARDHEQLISRQKDLLDNATPSGNSMAATALLRLGKLTGRGDFLGSAEQTMRAAAGLMSQSPSAMGQMILALDMLQGPTPEIVLLGDAAGAATRVVLDDLRSRYLPNKVVACRGPQHTGQVCSPALDGLFASKQPAGPEPTVFVCQNFTCQAPLSGQEAAAQAWDELLRLARAEATRQ